MYYIIDCPICQTRSKFFVEDLDYANVLVLHLLKERNQLIDDTI